MAGGDVNIKMEAPSETASPLHHALGDDATESQLFTKPSGDIANSPRISEHILPSSEVPEAGDSFVKSSQSVKRNHSLVPPSNASSRQGSASLANAVDGDHHGDTYSDFADDDLAAEMVRAKKAKRALEPSKERSSSASGAHKGQKRSETPSGDHADTYGIGGGVSSAADILRTAIKSEGRSGALSKSSTPPVMLADLLVNGGSKSSKPRKASEDGDGEKVESEYLGSLSAGKPKTTLKKTGSKKGTARSMPGPKKSFKANGSSLKTASSVSKATGSDSSEEDGETYCICHGRDDHRWMIACDTCDNWFHGDCVGIPQVNQAVIDKYICPSCETETSFTTYVPFCRLESCYKPSKIYENPPSEYCSKEHQVQYLTRMVKKLRTDDQPSYGGKLNADEVGSLVMAYDGDYDKWSGLFTRPTISKESELDWTSVYTEEENDIIQRGNKKIEELDQRIRDLREQTRLVQMIIDRAEEANKGREKKRRICGFDPKLTFTLDEFLRWKSSPEGTATFQLDKLATPERKMVDPARYMESDYFAVDDEDPAIRGMCIRAPEKDCKRHYGWQQLQMDIQKGDIKNTKRTIRTIKERHVEIREAAEEREALRNETDKTHWCEDVDPRWREKIRRKFEKVEGLKDPRYGIPIGREHEYAGGF